MEQGLIEETVGGSMDSGHEALLRELEDILVENLGFSKDAVLRDYLYADYFQESPVVRKVDIAAFAETPPSYRSACIAICRPVRENNTDQLGTLRALGARNVIVLGSTRASIWSFQTGVPEKVEEHPIQNVAKIIKSRASDWSPDAIIRLGEVGPLESYQLDLFDTGLLPMIEREVNRKLDRLIREVMSDAIREAPALSRDRPFRQLVRLVFWLLAAKVLIDKEYPGAEPPGEDGSRALQLAERHFRAGDMVSLRFTNPLLVDQIWREISNGFNFRNISIDSLAFVYENTLVSPEARQRLGIHGTPRAVAEMVVSLLPLEELPENEAVILEACSGFGPFLLASMRRLRSTKLFGISAQDRHQRLVAQLRGIELDSFAVEVGRLCLTLADYPASNGWQLINDDVYAPRVLERALDGVGAVLANPPFEKFTSDERSKYGVRITEKPAELLRRILEISPPRQLGFIIPRMLPDNERQSYRELRESLRSQYREIDRIDLPDNLFGYSSAETSVIVARDRRQGKTTTLRHARAMTMDADDLFAGRWQPDWRRQEETENINPSRQLQVSRQGAVWKRLALNQQLGAVADIHRGVQYRKRIADYEEAVFLGSPKDDRYALGLSNANQIRQYRVKGLHYIKIDDLATGKEYPWDCPKVIVNANRRRRGKWCITAAPDHEGRWCYQTLYGIWPIHENDWPIELLAAVLNGPLAAEFVHERSDKRHIAKGVLAKLPLPDLGRLDVERIRMLVSQASEDLDLEVSLRIDAEVLQGYDLPPRLERDLLENLQFEDRPNLAEFNGFYPPEFGSALPLKRVLADLVEGHRIGDLLNFVPVLEGREVTEVFDAIAEGFGE